MADSIFYNVYNHDVLACLTDLFSDEGFPPPPVASNKCTTLLACRWESVLLVNEDNDTLKRLI